MAREKCKRSRQGMRVLKRGRMGPVLGVERNHLRFHSNAFPFFDPHLFHQILIFCNRRKPRDERRSRAGRRKLREVVRL